MSYDFSGGIALAAIVLILVVAAPIKMGAHLAGAQRTSLGWCGLAAVVGVAASYVAALLVDDAFGSLVAALLAFILSVRFVLRSSFFGAIGISLIAVVLAALSISVLGNLGVITRTA